MRAKSLQLCLTLCDPMYHSPPGSSDCGLPCPPPGGLPAPRIEPPSLKTSALGSGFFTTGATWEAQNYFRKVLTEERIGWWEVFKTAQTWECSNLKWKENRVRMGTQDQIHTLGWRRSRERRAAPLELLKEARQDAGRGHCEGSRRGCVGRFPGGSQSSWQWMMQNPWIRQDRLDSAIVINNSQISLRHQKVIFYSHSAAGQRGLLSVVLPCPYSRAQWQLVTSPHPPALAHPCFQRWKREPWKVCPGSLKGSPKWHISVYSGLLTQSHPPQRSQDMRFYDLPARGGAGSIQWVASVTITDAMLCWEPKTGNLQKQMVLLCGKTLKMFSGFKAGKTLLQQIYSI